MKGDQPVINVPEALSEHRRFVALAPARQAFGQAVGWWWQENYGYDSSWPDKVILSHFGGPARGGWLEPNVKGWWMSRHDAVRIQDQLDEHDWF